MKLVKDKNGKTLGELQHAGVNEPLGSSLLTDKEPEDMCIKNGKRETHIDFCTRKQLGFFRRFHMHRQFCKLPVEVDNWIKEHAPEAFAEFKTHTSNWDHLAGTPIDPDNPPPRSACVTDPLASFKKGTKCDTSTFKPSKDQKQWDTWWTTAQAQARAQGVQEVLDPTCTTIDDEDGVCGCPSWGIAGEGFVVVVGSPVIPVDTSESVMEVGDETPEPVMAAAIEQLHNR